MWRSLNEHINSHPSLRQAKRRVLDPIYREWYKWHHNQPQKWVYRVSGMRRSGNHAFLYWLMGQMPGSIAFLNNLGPFQPPERNEINKIFWRGVRRPFLVVSYEDQPTFKTITPYPTERFGPAARDFQILILRDPYNFLASRIAWPDAQGLRFREDEAYRTAIINNWKEHAQRFLQAQENPQSGVIPVSFNHWFTNVHYRQNLAGRLQLTFSDRAMNTVTPFGHGSSFDGVRYRGRAAEAPVLERFRQMPQHSHYHLYRELCQDKELRSYGEQIFGETPPL